MMNHSTRNPMNKHILIIGGGIAGLYCAFRLQQQGYRITVLEANQQLGGRIKSFNYNGHHFDLGPTWFWPGQPLILQLIQQLGIDYFNQYHQGDALYADELGVQRFHFQQGVQQYRVKNGLYVIIDKLTKHLKNANVQVNHSVQSISKRHGMLIVHCRENHQPMTADKIIIAVPPRIALHSIQFSPSLPVELANSFRQCPTWMAGQAKFLAIYDRPFWRDSGLSGQVFSRIATLLQIFDASPAKDNTTSNQQIGALFGFISLPASQRKKLGQSQLINMAKSQLVKLFGEAANNPLNCCLEDWSINDNIATDQDNDRPSTPPNLDIKPWLNWCEQEQIYFTGTEIAPTQGGLLEGALEASELILERVL